MKHCEICDTEIPDDFGNELCYDCYDKHVGETARLKEQELPPVEDKNPPEGQISPINGISDPAYVENPEYPDKPQWASNVAQFERTGLWLWKTTKFFYTWIKDRCIDRVQNHPQRQSHLWKPKIVDVGCGSGAGSNILSWEADFVWGIDKNLQSVNLARELFTREKNNLYYSPQVSFDHLDITTDERQTMQFDMIVAIEIIEHIYDYKLFLTNIIQKFCKKNKKGEWETEFPTEFFISTPNRNNKSIMKDKPKSIFHVREWTAEEFDAVLKEFFKDVWYINAAGLVVDEHTDHTPIMAICSNPKI